MTGMDSMTSMNNKDSMTGRNNELESPARAGLLGARRAASHAEPIRAGCGVRHLPHPEPGGVSVLLLGTATETQPPGSEGL